MMSVLCVAIFWVVNASSGEKSCLQFSIPTGSGAGGKGGVSYALKPMLVFGSIRLAWIVWDAWSGLHSSIGLIHLRWLIWVY